MNTLEEKLKTFKEEQNKEMLRDNNSLKVRYFLWIWNCWHGWEQYGGTNGYASLEELKAKNKWAFGKNEQGEDNFKNWKILKAEVIESKLK